MFAKLFRLAFLFLLVSCQTTFDDATPTTTPEPIIPTATVPSLATVAATIAANLGETAVSTPQAAVPVPNVFHGNDPQYILPRFGVLSAEEDSEAAQAAGLPFGTLLNWRISRTLPEQSNFAFWQMIRLGEEGVKFEWDDIADILTQHPGSVWVVGNEPDVKWQDNVTPTRYAELYHEVYTFIKERDPSALVASGGISQSTPLRRAYLDSILAVYEAKFGEPMPVDIWTLHAFTLREERDSWGVDVPPGMNVDVGELYEIDDHDDIEIFKQNIIDFRVWMAERGYQERPLAITEYGILLPSDYGFPDETVISFMHQSFDFMLTASNETGYPADENRLVQNWFWYMIYDGGQYPTGNLYDPEQDALTPIGQAYAAYVNTLLGE